VVGGDPDATLGGDATGVTVASTSGLPVTLEVVGGPCRIEGDRVVPTSAGVCTIRATQAGNEVWLPASSTMTIAFVLPVGDLAATPGDTPVTVDVLANDFRGATLVDVGTARHGTVEVVDGLVRYRPEPGFAGVESFDYTVAAWGRRARARVLVAVGDQAPRISGARLHQPAGSTRVLPLEVSDPNGDEVSVRAVSSDPGVTATVEGTDLVLVADEATSGDVAVTLVADDGHRGTARSTVVTRVVPPAPTDRHRTLDAAGTTFTWDRVPTDDGVVVVSVDGHEACRGTGNRCTWSGLAGPGADVEVLVRGHDRTTSPARDADLAGHGEVLLATVFFDSGSAALTPRSRATLDRAIARAHGFGRAELDGYTDADGGLAFNLALSHRRTQAVAGYLAAHGRLDSSQAWHGEADPVGSNAHASGKAANRRVEVLVRY
jgi:outer membrane protein OmpA-like peptidoglycan-associated protein